MPSGLPQRSSNYAAPYDMVLNKASWDAALVDVGIRLFVLEAQRTDLQAVIDAGTTQALAMITENVAPQLEAVNDTITALNAAVAAAEDQLVATEAAIATLLAGSLTADLVQIETPIAGIVGATVQAALAEHQVDIEALAATVAGHTSDIAGKAPQATTYTNTEVDAALARNSVSFAKLMMFS